VAQYSIWLATERRMGWAASRALSTSAAGSLTEAKGVAEDIAFTPVWRILRQSAKSGQG
jgi:hypothetical protein